MTRKHKLIAGVLSGTFFLSGCSLVESVGLTKIEPTETKNPDFEDSELTNKLSKRWYYDNLTKEERALYNKLYTSFTNWEEKIEFDGIDSDLLMKVFHSILLEHPEMYYIGQAYEYTYYDNNTAVVYAITPTYVLGEYEYKNQMKEVEAVANDIIAKIKEDNLGEFGAELYVHDYLVSTVDYYTEQTTDTKKVDNFRTIYGALVEGKANCMGYSRAMTYLMNKLGIECISVTGNALASNGTSGPHEWNAIKVNDHWYQLDVCWDDPSYMSTDGEIKESNDLGIRHTYFNITKKDMEKTRTFDHMAGDIPECTTEKDNYYIKQNLMMPSIDEYQKYITSKFNEMMENGTSTEVKFTSKDDYIYAVKNITDILDKAAMANNFYGSYLFQGYPDERSGVLVCQVLPHN